ncbi:hypothetical protein LK994_12095 [Ferruginibacter lapsinanis]|uniref:beta strand repeat-containing protein n=1 Tax=Ferruginibacter lapsinanis TaxID=563172 RepID=UPI001E3224B0|nr:hypothetical protein [Ferruginibacter lapsinanis]UEG49373.1 hypothetical protein LK994_12095 [Ferruginibacter lapsinanis]
MRKFYILLFVVSLLFSSDLVMAKPLACPSPGTYTIGPTGNYASITAALTDISSCGSLSGAYIFELQSTYVSTVETFPITIPNLGTTATNTVTFRPAAGATNLSIVSSNDSCTINLNGAKYIYFDGRAGGTGTTKNLTIENTSTSLYVLNVAGASSSGTTITLTGSGASTTGLVAGMFVGVSPGSGLFAAGTKVSSVTDATHFVVTAAPTSALSATTVITAGYNNAAIKFINDASNNTIKYCYIKSRNKSATSSTVFFSNTTGTTGNDNNTVDNCDIGGDATNTPLNAIYSDGSTTSSATYNSGNIISNNDIHDFYNGIASPSGVLLRNSSDWTITGNSLYQSATRNLTTNSIQFNGINVTSSCTNSFQINNNYLGGTASKATGGALTFTGSGQFLGIATSVAGATSTISGNKVMNINFTSDGATANFRPIGIFAGAMNCTYDTISNIQLALYSSNAFASMIQCGTGALSYTTIDISNNVIKDVSLISTVSPALRAISFQGSPSIGYTVNNNQISNFSSSANISIMGIFADARFGTCTIQSNTINNISQTSTSAAGAAYGITTYFGSNLSMTIQKNTISNISSSSTYTTDPIAAGIIVYSTGTANVIDSNIVSGIRATYNSTSLAVGASGISILSSAGGGNLRKNKIYDITNISNNTGSLVAGCQIASGSWTVANNMISLTNGSYTTAALVAGIYDKTGTTGTRNYYYNSVYVGGSGPADSYGAALLYNCGSGTAVIKNNILAMARSKGAGSASFYAIANKTSNTANFTSDNNILNSSSSSSIGLWGTTLVTNDKDFTSWKSSTGGDNNSFSNEYIPFTDVTTGNLHINTADVTLAAAAYVSNIESRGATLSTTVDLDNDSRPGPTGSILSSSSAPDIGADEVDLVYGGDNIWLGTTSSVWTNATNWSIGVPNSTRNAVIPAGTLYAPAISASGSTKNVIIGLGSSLTVTSSLSIAGIIRNSGTFNAESGTIELNGTTAQAISGTVFTNKTIDGLKISNTAGVTVSSTAGDTLNITGSISFGNVNNTTLNTGDNITLRSTANATARIADVTNGGVNSGDTIVGKMIVERYLPMQNSSVSRRWRLLTTPLLLTGSPSISQAWQEGVANSSLSSPINPRPGYGTQITNGNTAAAVANGFDIGSTANPSIFYMNPGLAPTWTAPTSTLSTLIASKEGFMIFARGDRSVIINNQFVSAAPTTLAPKGNVQIGNVTKTLVTGKQVIGNPYASAISFDKVLLNGATPNDAGYYFYYWDPKTDGSHNVGKFITVKNDGIGEPSHYTVTPNTNSSGITDGKIESGAAIVINSAGAPNTITFHETDKITTSSTVGIASRPIATAGAADLSKVYTNLYYISSDGTKMIADGVANTYYPTYNNEVDFADVPKLISFNSKESISILRDGKLLSIETRKTLTTLSDTTYFEIRNLDSKNYRLEFTAENFKTKYDLYLEDAATASTIPIALGVTSGTGHFDFIVSSDIPGSANTARFKLLLRPSAESAPLPVIFSSIKAGKSGSTNFITWKVENEININQYAIERSTDGIHFSVLNETAANSNGTNSYTFIDVNEMTTPFVYYRIKSISNTGQYYYSAIAKVSNSEQITAVNIYPTVITDGQIHIAINNLPKGKYLIQLSDMVGRILLQKNIGYNGGDAIESIPVNNTLPAGKYQATLIHPDNTQSVYTVILRK